MLTAEGLSFIKSWEGFRARRYLCSSLVPTIGYGHVIHPGEEKLYTSEYVMSEPEALKLLMKDLERFENVVDRYAKVKLSARQRDALVSFCYNIGVGAFINSTLLKKLNAGDWTGASLELLRWCKGGKPPKTIEGLRRRREAERRIFIVDIPKAKLLKMPYIEDICVLPLSWEEPDYVRRALCA